MGNIREVVAKRVREVRQERGISQEELSDRAGFSRTYAGEIERKKSNPTVETIQKIAEVLDVEPWELLKAD